jgi:16S rRNA (guanine527-N7)-methyltransferase
VDVSRETAEAAFGPGLALAERYAELLRTDGVTRGLIGPREADRLWDRHLVNCAAAVSAFPLTGLVADVGSGAGLPGIPLAMARDDLRITLLEPLLRRTTFLEEVVDLLGLDNVNVVRGRAEEMIGYLPAVDVVTARAVAPLDRLAGWGLPLLRPHGEMLALKGDTAEEELKAARAALDRLGAVETSVVQAGVGLVDPPSTVIRVRVGESPGGIRAAARRARAARANRPVRGGSRRRR